MFRFELDDKLVNSLLRKVPEQLEYREGVILGKFKLPLGAVTVAMIPACSSSHVTVAIPFSHIKGDITGGFFLSKIVSAFWGTVSKKVESKLYPKLRQLGLPRETVELRKEKVKGEMVGKVIVSLRAVNRWLAQKEPKLRPSIQGMEFQSTGVTVIGELGDQGEPGSSSKKTSAKPTAPDYS